MVELSRTFSWSVLCAIAAFIRKVYSILVCQLSVTVLFIALFLFVYVSILSLSVLF